MTISEQMAADAAAAPSSQKLTIAQQMTADSSSATAPASSGSSSTNVLGARVGHWSNDVDANAAMGGAVVHAATGLAGAIIGGYRGLATLAFPEPMGANPGEGRMAAAARISQEAQQQFTYNPDAQRDPDAVKLIQAAGSKYSPLTLPAKIGGAAGNAIVNAPNGRVTWVPGVDQSNAANVKGGLAAVADAVTQVLGPGAVLKAGSIAGVARTTLRSIADSARISPAESAANAQALSQRATAAVQQSTPQPLTAPAQQPVPVPTGIAAAPQVAGSPLTAPAPNVPTAPTTAPRTPTIADASPELQQRVVQMADSGQPINPAVVQRHVEAETLPVPLRLTEGQATLDPATISNEMNSRGKAGPPVPPEFYNQQGKALGQNLDAIRQSAAPDIPPSNPTEHGQGLIDEYKAMDAPVVAGVSADYKALEDANGGSFPIDGQQLATNTQAALDKALKSGSVPPDLQSNLDKFANGRQMTFQDFETMRSDAADAQRTATDGRQRAAAGIIRDQLEAMPLTPEAAALKPLADKARASAKARFDAMDADPAYAAAVGDGIPKGQPSPLADSFIQKYLIGAPRANILNMRSNLAGSPTAMQTIPAATMDYLKGSSKADADSGNFAAVSFNSASNKLAPKFDAMLDPDSAAQVQQVGRVAKYTTTQPKGSFVNNSNSTVAAVGQVGLDFAKQALAIKTLGASKVLGGLVNNARAGSAAKASIAPGAGIGMSLSDLMKPDE